ncbi:MAG: GGDEF domain-containing protein [Lachnospiraceae bacterium]|nr:GGDEF domain-containing protein [Lachnospiraceae bacterium]
MKSKKKNIFIAISYVILVAAIPATLLFSKFIGNKLTEHIRHTIKNAADLCAELIEQQYENDMLLLESLAVRMSATLESDPQQGIDRMVSTAERYGMKRIAFSTPDGYTITTDGIEMNLAGVENFEKAMSGQAHLTSVISDIVDNEDVNIYSFPVYAEDNQTILGVLSAVYHGDMFKEMLSATAFDGEGYTYIVDRNGDVIINTKHHNAITDLDNVFAYMTRQQQSEEEIALLRSNLKNSEQGFLEIYNEKGSRYTYYLPLSVNDWYVFSVVPKRVAEETKKGVMLSITIYCICISLIAIYLVLSIRQSQREKNRLLKKALYEDTITGGRSYEKFKLDCQERLKTKSKQNAICAFLVIDNFNLVATLYGNEESNAALCRIYDIVNTCVGENGIVCRNGSNHFCIMYFYNELSEIETNIAQFNKMLHESDIFENMLHPSIGIYVVENYEESVDDMVSKARIAHETIKQGRSTIAYYDVSFRNAMYEDKHLEDEMEYALERHEFVPYLQPKYHAESGEICGAEALIRWITREGDIIPPGKFIPLAENNGFVRMLDREMFSMVCRLQKHLIEKGIEPLPVSVNISRQLMYDKSFVDDYYQMMQEMELPVELVQLEITETVLFEDFGLFRSTLERLREYGFRILMDDFGTGYSSLMMLKSVPIDEIKLDKSFIDDYSDQKAGSIIYCVLELAKKLGLPVVAEGVETENQYHYLKQLGCDFIQGYYFAKPMAASDYIGKLI